MTEIPKFYGKFRGTVINNVDPMQKGRIQVLVPDISPAPLLGWAMANIPFAGKQMGMWVLPQIGTGVWVEFEQGDLDFPIWSGTWWGSAAEPPALALAAPPAVPNIVLQSTLQNTLLISDMPPSPVTGGIILKSTTGATIVVNDTGIYIQNGKGASIMMTGPTITINQGALVIT